MKKIIIAILLAMLCATTACTANTPQPSEPETSQAQANEKPTTAAATAPQTTVEPTTEKPTEDISKAANEAYSNYLHEHSEWFTDVNYGANIILNEHNIAFTNLNRDGADELIFVHPTDIKNIGNECLSVVTYQDNETKTLCDVPLVSYAGAESYLWIVIGEDSNLYSVVDKSGAAKIIKYQYNNGKFDYDTVAEETKKVLYPREDNSFSVNGEDCTFKVFDDYKNSVLKSAVSFLSYDHDSDISAEDKSMSYDKACEYLDGGADKAEWQGLYLQTLDELDRDNYQGYKLMYIDGDDIPELLAYGFHRTTPSILYWVCDGKVCDHSFQLNDFYYVEKENYFLTQSYYVPVCRYDIKRIDGSEIITEKEGEVNTSSGEEYYKWNGEDLGSIDAFNNALSKVFNTDNAKKANNLKTYAEICEEINNYTI